MAPCWAVLAGFEPALALDFDGAFVNDSPLAWVARSSSKPGREGLDAWVLHADHGWSREYLELEADTIAQRLLDEFKRLSHIDQTPALLQAHRWRYALADNALDDGCLWDARLALGASGDWCAGPRLEGAFLSGLAAAEKVINAKATLS